MKPDALSEPAGYARRHARLCDDVLPLLTDVLPDSVDRNEAFFRARDLRSELEDVRAGGPVRTAAPLG